MVGRCSIIRGMHHIALKSGQSYDVWMASRLLDAYPELSQEEVHSWIETCIDSRVADDVIVAINDILADEFSSENMGELDDDDILSLFEVDDEY